ncbi:MAG: Ig domain-containing protein [Clostridia bacterium]|nr:Ig domain-containing protein [Clostridia bacterium]
MDSETLSLTSGSTGHLAVEVFPEDATDRTVSFTSSDEAVATARPDGTVLAEKPGIATLTCLSADGRASATCQVTVRYTTWQWVRHYVLFGWLWEE